MFGLGFEVLLGIKYQLFSPQNMNLKFYSYQQRQALNGKIGDRLQPINQWI
jgi:hypothetical protein